MDSIISINNVSKSFSAKKVLTDVSLEVPTGSVFGFLGNNGAGKSTFIRLLLNLLKPDSGEISVFGQPIHFNDIAYRNDIGCLVDSACLYLQLTPTEYLSISQKVKGLPASSIAQALELVEMTDVANEKMHHFSYGMKQRIALANVLIGSPKLLILDEPTNGLDPRWILEVRKLLKDLPNRIKTTVFVSSHLLDEIEKMATHVAILEQGRITSQSTLQNLLQQNSAYLQVHTSATNDAYKLLITHGFGVTLESSEQLAVKVANQSDCIQIHHILAEQKIPIVQSVYQQPTLEKIFLDNVTTSKFIVPTITENRIH